MIVMEGGGNKFWRANNDISPPIAVNCSDRGGRLGRTDVFYSGVKDVTVRHIYGKSIEFVCPSATWVEVRQKNLLVSSTKCLSVIFDAGGG